MMALISTITGSVWVMLDLSVYVVDLRIERSDYGHATQELIDSRNAAIERLATAKANYTRRRPRTFFPATQVHEEDILASTILFEAEELSF